MSKKEKVVFAGSIIAAITGILYYAATILDLKTIKDLHLFDAVSGFMPYSTSVVICMVAASAIIALCIYAYIKRKKENNSVIIALTALLSFLIFCSFLFGNMSQMNIIFGGTKIRNASGVISIIALVFNIAAIALFISYFCVKKAEVKKETETVKIELKKEPEIIKVEAVKKESPAKKTGVKTVSVKKSTAAKKVSDISKK